MTADDLLRVLRMRSGFEAVNHQESANQLRVLGRVQKQGVNGWLLVARQLLLASERSDWSLDVSKQYFLRGGKIMFGWRLILQGNLVAQRYEHVAQVVANAPRARAIVEEQLLPGARAGVDRNAPSLENRGKGAQGSLKAVVGPFASAALRRGG